jgi:zeaxanthin glucosyltransferase
LKTSDVAYIALLTPAFIGHVNPMIVLGHALMRRHHRIVMIAPLDAEERIRRGGIEFIALDEQGFPRGEWDRRTADIGELSGFAASRYAGKWIGEVTRGIIRDLPRIIDREKKFDGFVMDQISIGVEAVCQVEKIPLAVACNALAFNPDWNVPPFIPGWKYRDSLLHKIRNALGYLAVNMTGIPIVLACAKYRRQHKLGLMTFSHANHLPPSLLQVAQQPAFFDFPRKHLPKNFHYTAPWKEMSKPADVPFPWHRLDGRPLIYASLGTLQNRLAHVFRIIAEACVNLDAQLIISFGHPQAILPDDFPGNPIIVGYAPQLALLQRATLLITHAGLNTALEALMLGIPMVAIPITHDQPGVAARIEHIGVGEQVALKKLTAEKLRSAVQRVLGASSYREKAKHWANELKKINGPELAAELIENAFAKKT